MRNMCRTCSAPELDLPTWGYAPGYTGYSPSGLKKESCAYFFTLSSRRLVAPLGLMKTYMYLERLLVFLTLFAGLNIPITVAPR